MTTKLRIGSADAALIFRKNGSVEAVMPLFVNEADPPGNVLAAEALLWACADEGMMAAITKAIGSDGVPDA